MKLKMRLAHITDEYKIGDFRFRIVSTPQSEVPKHLSGEYGIWLYRKGKKWKLLGSRETIGGSREVVLSFLQDPERFD